MNWRGPAVAWLIGGLALACMLVLVLIRWPALLRGSVSSGCLSAAVLSGPMRPVVQSAIERLAAEPFAGATQATDKLASNTLEVLRIAAPAQFPASTYVVRFGRGEGRFAVIANAEDRVPHYSLVVPGVTDVGGAVRLDGFAALPSETSLTAAEVEYLLSMVYARLCPGRPAPEAAALNRLKDAMLTIRFGPGPDLARFHRGLVSCLSGAGTAC